MARGKRKQGDSGAARTRGPRGAKLPEDVRCALPAGVAAAWEKLAGRLPAGVYLTGSTALAVRLHHRTSRDLDFFYHGDSADPDGLATLVAELGGAVTYRGKGTLRAMLGATKLEFLHADETHPQHQLERPDLAAGMRIAGLKDLMAMKLKVLAERGELRDYYDVMAIEQRTGLTVEDGIALYLDRYGLDRASDAVPHLVRALGYLDDADEDRSLPVSKAELAAWWRKRQARVVRNLGR